MDSKSPRRGGGRTAPADAGGADPGDSMIIASSDRGHVGRDDRGQAQWKWATESPPSAPSDPNAETFDFLIDASELAIEDEQEDPTTEIDLTGGYNPYEKPA